MQRATCRRSTTGKLHRAAVGQSDRSRLRRHPISSEDGGAREASLAARYRISSDPDHFDLAAIHAALRESYWSQGIPREVVARAIAGSLCFGVLEGTSQIAFARVVTDRATFAYLCDVIVVPAYRGQGIGRWLIRHVMEHPDLRNLRRFLLVTRDAHALYEQFGFERIEDATRMMQIVRPDIYLKPLA